MLVDEKLDPTLLQQFPVGYPTHDSEIAVGSPKSVQMFRINVAHVDRKMNLFGYTSLASRDSGGGCQDLMLA